MALVVHHHPDNHPAAGAGPTIPDRAERKSAKKIKDKVGDKYLPIAQKLLDDHKHILSERDVIGKHLSLLNLGPQYFAAVLAKVGYDQLMTYARFQQKMMKIQNCMRSIEGTISQKQYALTLFNMGNANEKSTRMFVQLEREKEKNANFLCAMIQLANLQTHQGHIFLLFGVKENTFDNAEKKGGNDIDVFCQELTQGVILDPELQSAFSIKDKARVQEFIHYAQVKHCTELHVSTFGTRPLEALEMQTKAQRIFQQVTLRLPLISEVDTPLLAFLNEHAAAASAAGNGSEIIPSGAETAESKVNLPPKKEEHPSAAAVNHRVTDVDAPKPAAIAAVEDEKEAVASVNAQEPVEESAAVIANAVSPFKVEEKFNPGKRQNPCSQLLKCEIL